MLCSAVSEVQLILAVVFTVVYDVRPAYVCLHFSILTFPFFLLNDNGVVIFLLLICFQVIGAVLNSVGMGNLNTSGGTSTLSSTSVVS